MGTENSRRKKHEWFMGMLKKFWDIKPKQTIDTDKLLAEFAITNCSTVKSGLELLDLFEQVGAIEIKGDEISKGRNFK